MQKRSTIETISTISALNKTNNVKTNQQVKNRKLKRSTLNTVMYEYYLGFDFESIYQNCPTYCKDYLDKLTNEDLMQLMARVGRIDPERSAFSAYFRRLGYMLMLAHADLFKREVDKMIAEDEKENKEDSE